MALFGEEALRFFDYFFERVLRFHDIVGCAQLKTAFDVFVASEHGQEYDRYPHRGRRFFQSLQNVGGNVQISLEELGQSFMLTVSDSGIGIPESERGRIFEKMFRGSNASLVKAGGTGLGLYMVKKVVLLLGGTIRFESEENKETTFFIELPREQRVEEGARLVS